eukprot:9489211-Pyramimonas_sp.AAC.1
MSFDVRVLAQDAQDAQDAQTEAAGLKRVILAQRVGMAVLISSMESWERTLGRLATSLAHSYAPPLPCMRSSPRSKSKSN